MSEWKHSKKRSDKTKLPYAQSSIEAISVQIVDLCLIGIIFIAPLFFGGRHAMGQAVFVSLCSAACIAWAIHVAVSKKTHLPNYWACTLAISMFSIVAFQIIPLPYSWLRTLAPRNTDLLILWGKNSSLGTWSTLSLNPSSTKVALTTLTSYLFLFCIFVGRLKNKQDIKHWTQMLAISTVLMAVFGIIQYLTSNGLYFWFYKFPYSETFNAAKGSFTCKNHFAHLLILGIPLLLAWSVNKLNDKRIALNTPNKTNRSKYITLLFLNTSLAVVVIAVLLSYSRGAFLVLSITLLFSIVTFTRLKLIPSTYFYSLVLTGIIAAGTLSSTAYNKLTSRLDDFASASLDGLDHNAGRRRIWKANIETIKKGGIFGSGSRTHPEIYPVYIDQPLKQEYTHAENGYLQIITENGLLGALLIILVISTLISWSWKAIRYAKCDEDLVLSYAIAASLASSIIHSIFDFVWFIPSCMSYAVILAAVLYRLLNLNKDEKAPNILKRRLATWSVVAAACIMAAATAAPTLAPAAASLHWDRYLLSSKENKEYKLRQLRSLNAASENPAEQVSVIENSIYHLKNTIKNDPEAARAHLRLAGKYLQLFNLLQRCSYNNMSVEQIRDAAIASQFSTPQKLNLWLRQAFGKKSQLLYKAYHHTRRALQLSPLQGEGYLYLASLCFIEGKSSRSIAAYIEQSQILRPSDNAILFEVGRQKMILGDFDEALNLWKRVYRQPSSQQYEIIKILSNRIPAQIFAEFFQPDWHTLLHLWKLYRHNGTEQDTQALIQYAHHKATTQTTDIGINETAEIWYVLANMYTDIGKIDQALPCMQTAYSLNSNSYRFRRKLGHLHLDNNNFSEAEKHLRWCLARKNDDANLKNQLLLAKRGQMELASSPIQKSYK